MSATLKDYRQITPPPPMFCPAVDVRGFSHLDRSHMLAALESAMNSCGCWLLDQRAISAARMELVFEVQLRAAFDLYRALIAAGVELIRDSHATLTGLCTLRRHNFRLTHHGHVVTVRLEVNFLKESGGELDLGASGLA